MDPRFTQESGSQAYTGVELLVKGALEGGVSLITGYPGSPVADVFDAARAARDYLDQHGIVAVLAHNEALAAARLNGSQMQDIRAMAVMKSVGAHVASDALAIGNLAKTGQQGGALVVIGDDPWSDSTQVPADSRYLASHMHMPVLEPSTFQEMKDWVKTGFDLSAKSNLYLAYLVTTNQADGGAVVETRPNVPPKISRTQKVEIDTAAIPVEETVLLPPRTSRNEEQLHERYRILWGFARDWGVNAMLGEPSHGHRAPIGLVAGGLAYCYLEHALRLLGLTGRFPILKLGISFPVDPGIVQAFAGTVEKIVVVEEKRGFVESQIVTILNHLLQGGEIAAHVPVWGKEFPLGLEGFPATRGLSPSLVMERLARLLLRTGLLKDPAEIARAEEWLGLFDETALYHVNIPARTPTFCPGCPHRDSSAVLMEIKKDFLKADYMRKGHHRGPVDLVFHGDTGCYTMLMFEPTKALMHNYSGMGLGGGTGAGIDPFITNKQVVFMGDSTFFHSGMIAISDAMKNHQDIAFIILDNKTTAMTGHQPTPSVDVDMMGKPTFAQDIEHVLQGMTHGAGIAIVRTNPAYRDSYRALLEDALLRDGVKVVIADKECGITYHRREGKEKRGIIQTLGYLPEEKRINVDPEVCEQCLECTKQTGCPGLNPIDTLYGKKMATDLSTCVSDGACTRIYACPSFEEVVIQRSRPVPSPERAWCDPAGLPDPVPVSLAPPPSDWSVYLSGVGGMGIGVVTGVLVRAAMKEDYRVHFVERKGLAIRNGGVYAQVLLTRTPGVLSPIIPYGTADLLLGVDLLEAVRGIEPSIHFRVAHPRRTAAVVNTAKTPTIKTLMGVDDFNSADLEDILRTHTRADRYFGANVSAIAEKVFGTKIYANLILLGIAAQKGHLPVRLPALLEAIKESVPAGDLKHNVDAFHLGRRIAVQPAEFDVEEPLPTYAAVLEEKVDILRRRYRFRPSVSEQYLRLVTELADPLRLDDGVKAQIAQAVYDCIRYQGVDYAQLYVRRVKAAYARDSAAAGYAATRAVIWNLRQVMLIKDEVFVAELLTSEEKKRRDERRYRIDPDRGDRILYRHLNRPEFAVLGMRLRFRITTRPWMLSIVKRFRFLRRVLPDWHRKERDFRDWYINLVERFVSGAGASSPPDLDRVSYDAWVRALSLADEARGFREVRYPKMEKVRQQVDEVLKEIESRRSGPAPAHLPTPV